MQPIEYLYRDLSHRHPTFEVTGRYSDGSHKVLGRVEYRWFRHLNGSHWEATAADGSHRAVHDERWQAAWALGWNGIGYPFPVHPRYRPAA